MNSLNNSSDTPSPFHQGEQEIQQRLGVRDKMERFGRQVIRDHMPEQHRQFYAQLPFIFAGYTDQQGWPWASILFNQPGFISTADNKHLLINTLPVSGDPLSESLATGSRLGLLGIELETRRRNRLSTHITHTSEQGIELAVDQAFGNCPQYIQQRELHSIDPASMPPVNIEELSQFDSQAIELISNSDTFFVASYAATHSAATSEGADVSHRGGKPGFIRVDDKQTLTIPDYLGNFHFNTLGNFAENAKAGLLFIDFEQGHLLTLTGTVEILWDSPETQFFAGAERLWKFHIAKGRWLKNVLPLRWQLQDYSPNTELTGSWKEAEAAKKATQLKNTWQAYQVSKIVEESSLIKSFYLQTPAGQKPQFKPGQFLTLKANIANKEQIRTYTVSSAPADTWLRISIKHERGNNELAAGIFSSFMHQQISVGDIIHAKAPTGSFTFNTSAKHPAVLIAAGIGITPMMAMARHTLQEAVRTRSIQAMTLICSARNSDQRAFFAELNQIAENSAGHIRVLWALSQAESHLKSGVDYHHSGRISRQWLANILPSDNDYDVYLCGPNSFMQSQYNSLRELGVSDAHIFAEAFGPASLIRDKKPSIQPPIANEAIVTFSESHIEQAWSKADGNLLEFAEAHGLTPEYGCRSGQCGACKAKLLKGKIAYQQTIETVLDKNEILLCFAVPAADTENKITRLEIQL
ncbi:MAG: 2Fe-2S iron-sulfur cluster binding domain-containing protein [Methyloprofundus sp.]|nr:2Fe-2S iron-sulfur cluster binding domain-containing protein [Methyloprofundus sp.]